MIELPVLALDLGTKTGWAFGVPGYRPEYGEVNFGSLNPAHSLHLFDQWLSNKITTDEPGLIAAEQPNIIASNGFLSTLKSCSFHGLAQLIAYRRDILFQHVPGSSAQKTFTGSAKGPRSILKARCLAECEKRSLPTKSEDAADAIAVWFHACQEIIPTVEKVA